MNVTVPKSPERSSPVMLSAAKHLAADRDRPFVYEVPTSSPWMCTNIVATGSNGCSPWKQHHGSLADLRCQETGWVTRLVTPTDPSLRGGVTRGDCSHCQVLLNIC